MLTVEDFITVVYCLVDDLLAAIVHNHTNGKGLRPGCVQPKLSDSEVITMIVVGEFLGKDTDKGIWRYFKNPWQSTFPELRERTRFVRRAADLWWFIGAIQHMLAKNLGAFEDDVPIVDGLPMIVANFNRAPGAKLFRGEASIGYCASKKLWYYGFHGHLCISFGGVITGFSVTEASASEREAMWDVLQEVSGKVLGDKGYIGRFLGILLREENGIELWTPVRKNMKPTTGPRTNGMLCNVRRRVETVIGQRAERLHIERVRARDTWHLTVRVQRKLLAHTIGMWLLRQMGVHTMELDLVVAALGYQIARLGLPKQRLEWAARSRVDGRCLRGIAGKLAHFADGTSPSQHAHGVILGVTAPSFQKPLGCA